VGVNVSSRTTPVSVTCTPVSGGGDVAAVTVPCVVDMLGKAVLVFPDSVELELAPDERIWNCDTESAKSTAITKTQNAFERVSRCSIS
jgi:hypothetical protein